MVQVEALERRIAASERQRAADRQRDLRSTSSDDFGLESEHSPRSVRLRLGQQTASGVPCILSPLSVAYMCTCLKEILATSKMMHCTQAMLMCSAHVQLSDENGARNRPYAPRSCGMLANGRLV